MKGVRKLRKLAAATLRAHPTECMEAAKMEGMEPAKHLGATLDKQWGGAPEAWALAMTMNIKISAWLPCETLLYSCGEGDECCIGLAHHHYVCLAGRPTSEHSVECHASTKRGGAYSSYHESRRRTLRATVRRVLRDHEDGDEFSMCLDRGHQVRHLRQRVARRLRTDPNSFDVCAGRRSDPLAEDCIIEDGNVMYV